MKKSWMAELASHYDKIRRIYPQDRLMIVFDIDGTILDMRYSVLHILRAFDRERGTSFFQQLGVTDITVHESQVDQLLSSMQIQPESRDEILQWYDERRWLSEYILQSHRPYAGVLEVIRWFQLQPNTFVGINTGRPETMRKDTLRSLNELAKEYRVHLSDDLLRMNPKDRGQAVEEAKVEGIRYFLKMGYRVFAVVDNEPGNLKAISGIDSKKEILLLHADTIFESKRARLPSHAVKGRVYDLTELIVEKALPQHIQFVWHGINDEVNLRQFLASDINWGECDVRFDPFGQELILRHDSFKNSPLDVDEGWMGFDNLLSKLHQERRSIKIDLKTGGILIDKVLNAIDATGFDDSRLWFNGSVERLLEQGFRKIAAAHPNAILQCTIDFLAPLTCTVPEKAKELLDMFTSWGVNRFSIDWQIEDIRAFFDQMDKWGFEINIYNVPDLESFLQTVLLMPRSITSDFNFPKWHYYGKGSGKNGSHYEYSMRKTRNR